MLGYIMFFFPENNPSIFQNMLNMVLRFAPPELKKPPALRKLLENAPKNATYRSKTIQNQIISVFADHIIENIVGDIKKSKYFSVMADKASDISNKEQMSVVLQYLDTSNKVREKFVSFLHGKDGTSG